MSEGAKRSWRERQSQDLPGPHEREAAVDQGGAVATHALAAPRSGEMAGACREWLLNYHAVRTNYRALMRFRDGIIRRWQRVLSRRSQKGRINWTRMLEIAGAFLPPPIILHPWRAQRFAVHHPR